MKVIDLFNMKCMNKKCNVSSFNSFCGLNTRGDNSYQLVFGVSLVNELR